jgi:hypothetical protein
VKSLSICIVSFVLVGILGCSGSSTDAQNSKLKPVDPSAPKAEAVKDKSKREISPVLK